MLPELDANGKLTETVSGFVANLFKQNQISIIHPQHQQPVPPDESDADEEDGSAHSSSSDTLTCSTPEVKHDKHTSLDSVLLLCASLFHRSFTAFLLHRL